MTVRNRLSELDVWATGDVVLDAGPTMASPSWWGADSERYSGRADIADDAAGSAAFVKVMESQAWYYVDFDAAFSAATAAGAAGIGPKVFISDANSGVLVMEDFTGISSTATLDLFDEDANVEKLVALRKSGHGLAGVTRRASVFDDLAVVEGLIAKVGGAFPADFDWMRTQFGQQLAMDGVDLPGQDDGDGR